MSVKEHYLAKAKQNPLKLIKENCIYHQKRGRTQHCLAFHLKPCTCTCMYVAVDKLNFKTKFLKKHSEMSSDEIVTVNVTMKHLFHALHIDIFWILDKKISKILIRKILAILC